MGLVLGMIQSLLKLVTISAFIAQPCITLPSMRNTVLEHLKSLVGACKKPQAKQACAAFTGGTIYPAVRLGCSHLAGSSARGGSVATVLPSSGDVGRAAAQDHTRVGCAAHLTVWRGLGKMYLWSDSFWVSWLG